jgi:hypothetical protein
VALCALRALRRAAAAPCLRRAPLTAQGARRRAGQKKQRQATLPLVPAAGEADGRAPAPARLDLPDHAGAGPSSALRMRAHLSYAPAAPCIGRLRACEARACRPLGWCTLVFPLCGMRFVMEPLQGALLGTCRGCGPATLACCPQASGPGHAAVARTAGRRPLLRRAGTRTARTHRAVIFVAVLVTAALSWRRRLREDQVRRLLQRLCRARHAAAARGQPDAAGGARSRPRAAACLLARLRAASLLDARPRARQPLARA